MSGTPGTSKLTFSLSRRQFAGGVAGSAVVLGSAGAVSLAQEASPVASMADAIQGVAAQFQTEYHLRAVLVRVVQGGEEVTTFALGESMTGVPATVDMHFRNGAVAISLVSTLLLTLVDDGLVGLDDTIDAWLPDLPDADRVTLRMLANMTAGYRDYVQSEDLIHDQLAEPFREFTFDDLMGYSFGQPRLFEPGENWEYAHTAYVLLGKAMEAITGEPVEALMQTRVLDPLGLTGTQNAFTAEIPEPVLHAFTSERRAFLEVESGVPFYEESTFWNPSWSITSGAIQTTTIADMATSMEAVGKGTLLSPESFAAQMDRGLVGFGEPLDGCNSCHTFTEDAVYGLGVWMMGPWVMQNPLFSGYAGTAGYSATDDVSIAVAVTYGEAAFDPETGDYANGNVSTPLFQAIGALMTGDAATPAAG